MKKLDLLGNKVKAGDIMLENTGGGWSENGDSEYEYQLYQVPKKRKRSGICYNVIGEKIHFKWTEIENSIKLDTSLLPDGFEYSFRHGMTAITSSIDSEDPIEIIENSNWKQSLVTEEDVDLYLSIQNLKLNTVEDVESNIVELHKYRYINWGMVCKVLKTYSVKKSIEINGEIGISFARDLMNYKNIIDSVYLEKINQTTIKL